jgi:hypothetical protein
MRSDANEKAHTAWAVTEGTGSASESLQLLTILKSQGVVIWEPSQIFANRKKGRPLAREIAPSLFGHAGISKPPVDLPE